MKISQVANLSGFQKWSVTHPSTANDDDRPGGATPVALAAPEINDRVITSPEAYGPWPASGG